jgi:hypothetical protein
MTVRLIPWVRVLTMLCIIITITLGLSSSRASMAILEHSIHGDVATSDGGWIVAACQDHTPHCSVDNDYGSDLGDGHHHHRIDIQGSVLPTAVSQPVLLHRNSILARPDPYRRLEGAEPSGPGHVPRAHRI